MRITKQTLFPFLNCFVGRKDDYALQQADGRYRRVHQPLTSNVLFEHLQGACTVGSYVIDEHGLCCFAVFDADMSDGLFLLASVQKHLAGGGIPSYLEASRRGAHLWVLLADPLPPAQLRQWLLPYCPEGVEFYPKQSEASREHPGSLVRLPLGIHRLTGERYPFVSLIDGQLVQVVPSVVDALSWLATVERAQLPAMGTLGEVSQVCTPTHTQYPSKKAFPALPVVAGLTIRDWCLQQDPFQVIGRYVDLREDGLGCCPFGSHHSDGCDTHPSFRVYVPTFPNVCCWYCHTWQAGGSVFDFLRYYYDLEPRDLWSRICRGAQF